MPDRLEKLPEELHIEDDIKGATSAAIPQSIPLVTPTPSPVVITELNNLPVESTGPTPVVVPIDAQVKENNKDGQKHEDKSQDAPKDQKLPKEK